MVWELGAMLWLEVKILENSFWRLTHAKSRSCVEYTLTLRAYMHEWKPVVHNTTSCVSRELVKHVRHMWQYYNSWCRRSGLYKTVSIYFKRISYMSSALGTQEKIEGHLRGKTSYRVHWYSDSSTVPTVSFRRVVNIVRTLPSVEP